ATEAGDGGQARLLAVHLRIACGGQSAVRGEADVVELDLVETLPHGFLGDGDVVVPDFFAERIDPRELLVVDPRPSRTRVDDGPLRLGAGQNVVLEGDDAGDGVDVARLEIGQEPFHVLERRWP